MAVMAFMMYAALDCAATTVIPAVDSQHQLTNEICVLCTDPTCSTPITLGPNIDSVQIHAGCGPPTGHIQLHQFTQHHCKLSHSTDFAAHGIKCCGTDGTATHVQFDAAQV
mmetsp:Transcript_20979/g.45937  ORF Transcript_20979/g.45937 Transcript_20979/m.45937 type:complete len:111 (-) Transcript_20979:1029-1361(-)